MMEASPKVPIESQTGHTLRIPLFSSNASLLGLNMVSRSDSDVTNSCSASLEQLVYRRCFTESSIMTKCKCPHVMVADDDPFQAFYYQTLFQKSMSFEHISVKREDFRLAIFSSGEELIAAYRKYQGCDCGSVSLIITDYNMGEKKLNGFETIQELIKIGYRSSILLRTSDALKELKKVHGNLSKMLETKVVTQFLSKIEPEKTKEVVQTILGKIKG